jgi:hypothetical protein
LSQVIIGMDPHKRSATIEVMTADETVAGGGRYVTDAAGLAAMVAGVRQWPDRVWAVEGSRGTGRHVSEWSSYRRDHAAHRPGARETRAGLIALLLLPSKRRALRRLQQHQEAPMPTLTVSSRTYDRITDLARAWGVSDEAAIVNLIDLWKRASSGAQDEADEVRVHVVYLGERIDGIYHPRTGLMDIISGPVPKFTRLKPSPAAGEAIRAINRSRGKRVTGSRNGWEFWIVTATGEFLQSIRQKRGPASS